jgi:LPXTG-motif cell wall-anchored protein
MKSVFLLIVIPVLLVTLGFGQTPAPNVEQASIKGCLGGSADNYTVAEDGTTQTFRITSSTVDLKPHLGHDVEIVGQTANVAPSSGPADNTIIVTGVNMISDHCATATASTPAVADPTPTATASTPAAADATPAATASTPAVADQTPAATTSTQAAADPTPAANASAPVAANAPAPESTQNLPQTASSLPLLGLAGLGLLAMGLVIRRFRTN